MSDDAELQRIRAARLQQLAAQGGGGMGGIGGIGGGGGGAMQSEDDEQSKAEAADAARRSILTQILTPEAADRLGRIALVNAERARDVENRMIAMARSGQLRGRTTEDELLRLLAALRDRDKEAEDRGVGKVVFSRRKAAGWDDEEDGEDGVGVGVGYNN